ncbi:MAG: hypothetical protein ACTHY4_06540 [Flavobacteriaceae bacterium]
MVLITILGFVGVYLYINFILDAPVNQENVIQSGEKIMSYNSTKVNA